MRNQLLEKWARLFQTRVRVDLNQPGLVAGVHHEIVPKNLEIIPGASAQQTQFHRSKRELNDFQSFSVQYVLQVDPSKFKALSKRQLVPSFLQAVCRVLHLYGVICQMDSQVSSL